MSQELFEYVAPLLTFRPWLEAGIEHGFTDISFDFKEENWELSFRDFKAKLRLADIIIDRQVHGSQIVDLREFDRLDQILARDQHKFNGRSGIDADAIIVPRRLQNISRRIAIGVTAADCVPLIVKSSSGFALIHAGWRGLSAGIISSTIDSLLKGESETTIEIVIGPCAGASEYEVGAEVIAEIGEVQVSIPASEAGKYLLNLPATVRKIVEKHGYQAVVYSSEISTISDSRFHSYRRDGKASGRGLGFIIL